MHILAVLVLCLLPLDTQGHNETCPHDELKQYFILHKATDGYIVSSSECSDWQAHDADDEEECLNEACNCHADTIAYQPGICYSFYCRGNFYVQRDSAGNGFTIFRTRSSILRLSGGENAMSGTVEMYSASLGAWGIVCDADFSNDEWPTLVCNSLGYGHPKEVIKGSPNIKGVNIAQNKPTFESSSYGGDDISNLVVDGNTESDYYQGSCSHSQIESDPWWAVDLKAPHSINKILITNRGDCCGDLLSDFVVGVTNTSPVDKVSRPGGYTICRSHAGAVSQGATVELNCSSPVKGRYLVVQIPGAYKSLSLCEVQVFSSDVSVAKRDPQCDSDVEELRKCEDGDNCTAANSVHISCAFPSQRVRLTHGMTGQEGLVEFFTDQGEWGTVCDPGEILEDWPHIVCSEIGYGPATVTRHTTHKKYGPVGLQSPGKCDRGSVMSISQCGLTGDSCDHSHDVYLVCGSTIRLHGGDKPWNGYAQTYYVQQWGSICNIYPEKEGWPSVFCKELGYSKAQEAHRRGMNVALRKHTRQSSNYKGAHSSGRAVDGRTISNFFNGSCSHTEKQDDPWWAVDLGNKYPVKQVELTNRGDCCGNSLSDFYIGVTDASPWNVEPTHEKYTACRYHSGPVEEAATVTLNCDSVVWGRYLIVQIPGKDKTLTLCEVQVFLDDGDPVSGPVHLMNPECSPRDTESMSRCDTTGETCEYTQDVFLTCAPPITEVRLVDGKVPSEGRAECKRNGTWGVICDDVPIPSEWPSILCKDLGFGEAKSSINVHFNTTGSISLMNPTCHQEDARNLGECYSSEKQCSHYSDVWIVCDTTKNIIMGPRRTIPVIMLFDITGSLYQESTGSMLPLETEFLKKFFQHTSSNEFIKDYTVRLTTMPFKTKLLLNETWTLDYGNFSNLFDLRDAENNGLGALIDKIEKTDPEGLTNIGRSIRDLLGTRTLTKDTLVIVVSDFLNMIHIPSVSTMVNIMTSYGYHIIPAMIDSPEKREKLFYTVVERSLDKFGFDLAEEPDFYKMFDEAFNEVRIDRHEDLLSTVVIKPQK